MLMASDGHVATELRPIIEGFGDTDEPVKALDMLHLLDEAVWGGGMSNIFMTFSNIVLESAMEHEGTTHEELVKLATWRDGR